MPPEPAPRGSPNRWLGQLVVGPTLALYVGPVGANRAHAHHAVQLVVGVDDPVTIETGEAVRTGGAFLIRPGERHRVSSHGTAAVVLAEPHSTVGAALAAASEFTAGVDLSDRLISVGPPPLGRDTAEALRWCTAVVGALGHDEQPPIEASIPELAMLAVAYCDQHMAGRLRLIDVAQAIGTSPSRLTHVFSRSMGLPFRRYVVWRRVELAVREVHGGADITTAAARAGFADSAHFSRTFRNLFGTVPSAALFAERTSGGALESDRNVQADRRRPS